MLLKGFETKIELATFLILVICGLSLVGAIGYEAGTNTSGFGEFCYRLCDLPTFSRRLFHRMEPGDISTFLSLSLNAMVTAFFLQLLHLGAKKLYKSGRK